MLTPTKYMDLDLSLLRISSYIVKLLGEHKIMKYDEVLSYLSLEIGADVKHVFVPSLSFLYLLGKIEYHPISDSLEFLMQPGT